MIKEFFQRFTITQIIILHIIIWTGVYSFDLIPTWSYWMIVGPIILFHAWFTSTHMNRTFGEPTETATTEKVNFGVLEAEQIIVDEEFEEHIELDCGGYVELEGWREKIIDAEDVKGTVSPDLKYQDYEGYERLKVEK